MGFKFGRTYFLQVQLQSGSYLDVKLPLTVEFDISRNLDSSANSCNIRIYNLSAENRNQIRFNQFQDGGFFRKVIFQAGYGNFASPNTGSVIHKGQIQEAYSYREGTNFITEITSYDAYSSYVQRDASIVIPASLQNPLPKKEFFKKLIALLPDQVPVGAIGNYIGNYYRPYAVGVSPLASLVEESGKAFFIDNGKAFILQNTNQVNEYILSNDVPLINAASGLLGTPRLQSNHLSFDMLFEPSLTVGQLIQLQSATLNDEEGSNLNGLYKISELKHKGIISGAVCGEAITTIGIANGVGKLSGVELI